MSEPGQAKPSADEPALEVRDELFIPYAVESEPGKYDENHSLYTK